MKIEYDDTGVKIHFTPDETALGVTLLQMTADLLEDLKNLPESREVRQMAWRIEDKEALIGHS